MKNEATTTTYRVFGRGSSKAEIFRNDADANADVAASEYPEALRHEDGTVVVDAWCVDVASYDGIEGVLNAEPAVVSYSTI